VNPDYAAQLTVEPLDGPLDATVTVPGSKSITNRALLVAALADGRSELSGALLAEDTEAMLACLAGLGVSTAHEPSSGAVLVDGNGGRLPAGPDTVHLFARQSGTTARFLPPVLALGTGRYVLDGAEQLRRRPFAPLFEALRDLGVTIDAAPGDRLPVEISGGGPWRWNASVAISGDVSSQFISGLMMAAPLSNHGLAIRLTTPLVSAPYLALTARVMADFGVPATVGPHQVDVPAGRYRPATLRIEGDASAASYFLAAAAICGGRVRVGGLGAASTQGDAAFADVLAAMGCTVTRGPDWTEVRGPGPGRLHGVDVDLAALSDTAPTLAVVAPFAAEASRITGIGFIRGKESDRIGAVVGELRRLGGRADEEPDGIVVHPSASSLHGGTVRTYDDHRLAMAFALIGLRVPGVVIDDPGCVAKTFPTYWSVLERLRR
jgi:3-phosphoshikimate 1-carboxyvinyltransferase